MVCVSISANLQVLSDVLNHHDVWVHRWREYSSRCVIIWRALLRLCR
jgi:hypothetical protein